ncbi:MAG: GAF domain-containing protein [Bacteroidales bacterium]|nr:GAF domain-containing protein [Bacteroidales bacterium]HOY38927.1 GAF domain-containing protein [Bacteroidales bacterium]HQN92581.1 GAF domain-containing protein [Prolixibacteraceae bacterium]
MNSTLRYEHILTQLQQLFASVTNPIARMATVCALLKNKMGSGYYWTGYYLLDSDELIVGPYQGTLACMKLKKHTGVCWKAVLTCETIVVADVHAFSGHIACDPKSKSEIAVPLYDAKNHIIGVLDVDSSILNYFNENDKDYLEKINRLIYS